MRKYFFSDRALDVWNSLLNHVVLSDTVISYKTLKSKLDKFFNITLLYMILKPKFLEPEVEVGIRYQ